MTVAAAGGRLQSGARAPGGDDWRLGAFFATYFATAGVFAPYFPLYLEDRGLTAAEIGLVLAMMQAMRVVGPNLWGWLADRDGGRLAILRWTAVGACLAFAPIVAPGGFAHVFVVMLAVNLFITAQIPIGEAITADHLRAAGRAATHYGRLRAWGSVGFIVFVLAAGPLYDRAGVGRLPVVALVLLAASALSAFLLRDRPHAERAQCAVPVLVRLREPRVRWFFVSAAAMIFAHGALYTYFSLHLAQLGYSKTAIGAFWVVGVVVEIGFFYAQGAFFRRFGAFRLLSASLALAALRFAMIAALAQYWMLLLVAQVLHAATFAVHHSASVSTVQQWFPGAAASRGQALYVSIGYGIGGTGGSLVAAWLWSTVGPAAAFWSSSLAAVAGWCAVRRARALDARSAQPVFA